MTRTKRNEQPAKWFRHRAWVLAAVCMVVAGVGGWRLYSRWTVDRRLTSLAQCQGGIYSKELRGPDWYKTWVTKWKLPLGRRPYHFASSIATDADMKYVGKVPSLRGITLVKCPITDAGMIHLKGMRNVTGLNLNGTQVSDKTLEYIGPMADLKELHLARTAVTDAGLTHLRGLKKLEFLGLGRTSVTDKGIRFLTGLESLRSLDLGSTKITDAALEQIGKIRSLQGLYIGGTNITDEGLRHLKSLENLKEISISVTGVTPEGIAQLKAAIPNLKVMQ